MKKCKKVLATLFVMVSLVLMFACVTQARTYTKKINSYKDAIFTISRKGLNNKKAKWTVDNKKIADVNKNGRLTIKQSGKVTVTAKYKKDTYRFIITATNERKINSYIGKKSGLKISVVSMTRDWIKIKYTNTTKKAKTVCEAYFKLGKKVYYMDNLASTVIAPKGSRIVTLKRKIDFSNRIDVNANKFEIAWWYIG